MSGEIGFDSYCERLGPQGLRLIFAGMLDAATVQRLVGINEEEASARADALAELLLVEPERAPLVIAELDRKATGSADATESDDQSRERIAVLIKQPDLSAAPLLHRMARSAKPPLPIEELRAAAEVVAAAVLGEELGSRPKYMAKVASDRAGLRELEQDRRELEARVRQLETQLARSVEREASAEDRLGRLLSERHDQRQADKDFREERQRLEREVARLERRIGELNERRAREGTGELTTVLRRLSAEQRRIGANLDKLRNQELKGRDSARESSREISRTMAAMTSLLETLTQQVEASSRAAAAAQEAILRQFATLGASAEEGAEPRARRAKGEGAPRVAFFVDVQNMFYGAREKGARLDFEALLAFVTDERQLVRAVAYLVESREIDQRAFIHLLEMKAYEVKRKPLRVRTDRTMKGNWDLEMAIDALQTAPSVDVVVLVTGDGDFVPLVRQLKLLGKRVEVLGFPKSSAPDLREAADRFFAIPRRLLRPIDAGRRGQQSRTVPEAAEATGPEPVSGDNSGREESTAGRVAKSAAGRNDG